LELVLAAVAPGQGGDSDVLHNLRRLDAAMAFSTPPLRAARSREPIAAGSGIIGAWMPPQQAVGPTCSLVLTAMPVKVTGAYEIDVDATRSTTGAGGVAFIVTVDIREDSVAAASQRLTLESSLNETITVDRPGTYLGTATVTTPQGVAVGAYRYEGTTRCESSVTVDRDTGGTMVLFDVHGGEDRHVHPIEDTDRAFAQCSPLVSLKIGIAKRFRTHYEMAGASGVAIRPVSNTRRVSQREFFADAEVNKYLTGGSFIGTGLALWDLMHWDLMRWDLRRSDTWTPAWLLHVGVPLSRSARRPVFLVAEGSLFLNRIDGAANHYQAWAGLRAQFRR
jgi:hypothetical protein